MPFDNPATQDIPTPTVSRCLDCQHGMRYFSGGREVNLCLLARLEMSFPAITGCNQFEAREGAEAAAVPAAAAATLN